MRISERQLRNTIREELIYSKSYSTSLVSYEPQYPAHIFERAYVTEVLGIKMPLYESYPYSPRLHEEIIREQLLFEGFWSGLKEMAGKGKELWSALKDLFSNPEKIGAFISAIKKQVLNRMINPIVSFFKLLKEKMAAIGAGEAFPTFTKMADSILNGIQKVREMIGGMDGWKKAVGIMGLALAMKWIWGKVGDLIEEGKEQLEELEPIFEFIAEKGKDFWKSLGGAVEEGYVHTQSLRLLVEEEEEGMMAKAKNAIKKFFAWIKDTLIGKVVDFIKEQISGLAETAVGSALDGGVMAVWDGMKALYGGAKFVINTIAPALGRFKEATSAGVGAGTQSESISRGNRVKITKRQLRRIIKEEKQRLVTEKVGKKLFGWLKDKNWEEVAKAIETSEDIKTLGDLKFVLDLAMAAKTDEKAAEAWGDFAKGGLADMAGLGQVSALADVVKSTYKMDDDATSGVALNYLNVDDDVGKIVDDKIENAFLGELIDMISAAEASGDLDKPLSDFNVTKKLADYIAKDVTDNRTVSGFPGATQTEGRMIKTTKRQLRRIIREEKAKLLRE